MVLDLRLCLFPVQTANVPGTVLPVSPLLEGPLANTSVKSPLLWMQGVAPLTRDMRREGTLAEHLLLKPSTENQVSLLGSNHITMKAPRVLMPQWRH